MKMKVILQSFLIFSLAAVSLTACDKDEDPISEAQTIVDIAQGDANFSTLTQALVRTNLVSVLQGAGPFTVFAPTNEAFTALGVDLSTISDEDLSNILLYHVIGAQIEAADIAEGQTYASTATTSGPQGAALSMLIEKSSQGVIVNGKATVTTADLDASNGVIHVVDQVLLPMNIVEHAAANENFTQLVGALGAASGDLVTVLSGSGPFTVFAPVDVAFAEISDVVATLDANQLSNVLTYHVVGAANVRSTDLIENMEVMTVNGTPFTIILSDGAKITDANGNIAQIILTDVQATNGVIHVLNKVLLP
jgi:transforming growth factor-beta-induced protein